MHVELDILMDFLMLGVFISWLPVWSFIIRSVQLFLLVNLQYKKCLAHRALLCAVWKCIGTSFFCIDLKNNLYAFVYKREGESGNWSISVCLLIAWARWLFHMLLPRAYCWTVGLLAGWSRIMQETKWSFTIRMLFSLRMQFLGQLLKT